MCFKFARQKYTLFFQILIEHFYIYIFLKESKKTIAQLLLLPRGIRFDARCASIFDFPHFFFLYYINNNELKDCCFRLLCE